MERVIVQREEFTSSKSVCLRSKFLPNKIKMKMLRVAESEIDSLVLKHNRHHKRYWRGRGLSLADTLQTPLLSIDLFDLTPLFTRNSGDEV